MTVESLRPSSAENKERILPRCLVVKFGTKSLCTEGLLDQELFNDFARQIVELQRQGVEVIVVSSGTIEAGKEEFKKLGQVTEDVDKQVLAAVGQGYLMARWNEAFRNFGKTTGQILVTFTNWSNKEEENVISQTIFELLELAITPVINENDPVSKKEIELWERGISENDRLAGLIARKVGADAILFLTDEGGVFTDDPKTNPQARQFEEIPARGNYWDDMLGASLRTAIKAGQIQGMASKWREASSCFRNCPWVNGRPPLVAIAGVEPDVIVRFTRGEPVGTKIGTIARLRVSK